MILSSPRETKNSFRILAYTRSQPKGSVYFLLPRSFCLMLYAKLIVEDSTLVYMPHCELPLYERLFAANAESAAALKKIVLVGNDLQDYSDW
jgi:hypothetical protein